MGPALLAWSLGGGLNAPLANSNGPLQAGRSAAESFTSHDLSAPRNPALTRRQRRRLQRVVKALVERHTHIHT